MPKFTIPFFIVCAILCFAPIEQFAQTFNPLGTFDSNGKPSYLVPDDTINAALSSRILNSLPERYNVPQYNPHYLDTTLTHDLRVVQETDVWVTFVDEGAGYRNVLAFYTYDATNPPTTKPQTLNIVFPNMSKENNVVRVGNKIRLGRFPAGTGIGIALLADGFRNGAVTNGNNIYYSNPLFNPESSRALKQHSVLLRDESGILVMGFEDLLRTGGADNDFNDAVVYFTAAPGAVFIGNLPLTVGSNPSGISSGNNGGLESDGCLSEAIALRNFKRTKTPSVFSDNVNALAAFKATKIGGLNVRGENELGQFIPENPLHERTLARISTPNDLVGITNAEKVLAVDYFEENSEKRVAAVLTTKTSNRVYNHTKVICDRLTGASLLNMSTIYVNDLPLVRSTLRRADGTFEYAVNFSIGKNKAGEVAAFSRWGVESYPENAEFVNFQVWADAPHLAQKVAEEILAKAAEKYSTLKADGETLLPPVFVKNGHYDNGILTLTIHNPLKARSLQLKGNIAATETSPRKPTTFLHTLTGKIEEEVKIEVGSLFDFGFSIQTEKSPIADALYLADGAWGLDYDKTTEKIDVYSVQAPNTVATADVFSLERDPSVSGMVKGYFSLFRSVRAAGEAADLSQYKNVSFTATGTGVTEVTLVKKSIKEWGKQFRAEFFATAETRDYTLSFADFKNESGESLTADDIVDIVFTVKGDGTTAKHAALSLQNVVFDTKTVAKTTNKKQLLAQPNPATDYFDVTFDLTERQEGVLNLTNLGGQTVFQTARTFVKGENNIRVSTTNLPSGIYLATFRTKEGVRNAKIYVN